MKISPTLTENKVTKITNSLEDEKANSTRVIAFLGGLLFVIYSFLDYFGLPSETTNILYPIRVANLVVLGVLFAITYRKIFQVHYNKILLFGYFCSGFTICAGVYLSQPGEYSHDLYFAAFMIFAMTAFSWSYLPLNQSLFLCIFFISLYTLIRVSVHKDIEGTRLLITVAHVFFLISVVVVAAIAQYIRDNLIYKNIRLQQKLKIIVDEKTQEAKRQAKLANMDMLTGIPNRRYITECLRKALVKAEKYHTNLTLVFIDLNGFKLINDNYGHDYGDKVLEITAKRLSNVIRKEDYLARLGGDEFLIGFASKTYSSEYVNTLCRKLRKTISKTILFEGVRLKVTTSVGVASYPADGDSIEELVKIADKHMYIDKTDIKAKFQDHKKISANSISVIF